MSSCSGLYLKCKTFISTNQIVWNVYKDENINTCTLIDRHYTEWYSHSHLPDLTVKCLVNSSTSQTLLKLKKRPMHCQLFNGLTYVEYLIHLVSVSENVPSDMCAQRRFFRSAWPFAQSDHNLPLARFGQHMTVSSTGKRRLWSDCADVQAYLSLRSAHMSEGMFSSLWLIFFYLVNAQQMIQPIPWYYIWIAPSEFVSSDKCGQRRPRSACPFV